MEDPRLVWTDDGPPRSGRFDDVYFSAENGLAETRAVFLAGCGLPEAWAGRRRFTVGETGFGTGLNVLALLDLWRRAGAADGRLHVFTFEAFPLDREAAARAHAVWPELAEVSAALLRRWPPRTPGFHRIELPEFRAVVDVAHREAAEALNEWSGRADAWFLDGFAASANPEMWRAEVLDALAARSAPGARLATFTVAGAVRRGLAERGFLVERRPGFGRKRERLEAVFAGAPGAEPALPRIAVVGAGIAGASLARALVRLGAPAFVFDPGGPAAGASGNPAGLVSPRLDAGGGPIAAFYAQAYRRAVDLYRDDAPDAVIAESLLQLEVGERDAVRFDKVAAQDLWADGALERVDSAEASAALDEPVARGALRLRGALSVDPREACARWLEGAELRRAAVARCEPDGGGWTLHDVDGEALGRFDAVVVAAGQGASALCGAPLRVVRGQATVAAGVSGPAVAWGGYAIPTRGGLLFGATHDRDDDADEVRAADDDRNLATLAAALPRLAERTAVAPLTARAGLRATTTDRLPLAGAVPGPSGLYVLGGLGSRGLTVAPLLAEHLAAVIVGAPSPLPRALAALVDPDRRSARPRDSSPDPV